MDPPLGNLKAKERFGKNQNMLGKQWQLHNFSLEKLSRGNLIEELGAQQAQGVSQ